jgi:DNA-binding CsgD family transcriptional regulator
VPGVSNGASPNQCQAGGTVPVSIQCQNCSCCEPCNPPSARIDLSPARGLCDGSRRLTLALFLKEYKRCDGRAMAVFIPDSLGVLEWIISIVRPFHDSRQTIGNRGRKGNRAAKLHRGSNHLFRLERAGRQQAYRNLMSALTLSEREEISRGIAAHHSTRSMARLLGRSPSTVSRELSRNDGYDRYRAAKADEMAWARARRPKRCKLANNPPLRQAVASKLPRASAE